MAMAQTALASKADDLVILDLRNCSFSFDFFVLCSAASDRQIQAVSERIQDSISPEGRRPPHREGESRSGWVLLDYGSVVAHVFSPEVRRFYSLERLWGDAPRLRLPNHS